MMPKYRGEGLKAVLAIPFLLVAALVVYVHGSLSLFAIWNVLPVVAGFAAILAALRVRRAFAVGWIAFALSAAFIVTYFHLAWLLDWGGTKTSSSTSALAFIFIPIWACFLGVVMGLPAWGVSRVVCRSPR